MENNNNPWSGVVTLAILAATIVALAFIALHFTIYFIFGCTTS